MSLGCDCGLSNLAIAAVTDAVLITTPDWEFTHRAIVSQLKIAVKVVTLGGTKIVGLGSNKAITNHSYLYQIPPPKTDALCQSLTNPSLLKSGSTSVERRQ